MLRQDVTEWRKVSSRLRSCALSATRGPASSAARQLPGSGARPASESQRGLPLRGRPQPMLHPPPSCPPPFPNPPPPRGEGRAHSRLRKPELLVSGGLAHGRRILGSRK